MTRTIAAWALLVLALAMLAQPASAQDNVVGGAILGGAAGAIIGGAATGRAAGAAIGAAIGASTGAIIAAEAERRRGYYWWRNACYRQDPYGNWYRVARRNCM
jgi:hypothetical protein